MMSSAIKRPYGGCKTCQGSSNKTELFLGSMRPLLERKRAVLKPKGRLLRKEWQLWSNGWKELGPIKALLCWVAGLHSYGREASFDFWSITRGLVLQYYLMCSLNQIVGSWCGFLGISWLTFASASLQFLDHQLFLSIVLVVQYSPLQCSFQSKPSISQRLFKGTAGVVGEKHQSLLNQCCIEQWVSS